MKLYSKTPIQPSANQIHTGEDLFVDEFNALKTITTGGSAQTLDCSAYNIFDITLTANLAITFENLVSADPNNPVTVVLRQGGAAGGYAVTYTNTILWAGGAAPTLVTTLANVTVLQFFTLDNGTNVFGALVGDSYAAPA